MAQLASGMTTLRKTHSHSQEVAARWEERRNLFEAKTLWCLSWIDASTMWLLDWISCIKGVYYTLYSVVNMEPHTSQSTLDFWAIIGNTKKCRGKDDNPQHIESKYCSQVHFEIYPKIYNHISISLWNMELSMNFLGMPCTPKVKKWPQLSW